MATGLTSRMGADYLSAASPLSRRRAERMEREKDRTAALSGQSVVGTPRKPPRAAVEPPSQVCYFLFVFIYYSGPKNLSIICAVGETYLMLEMLVRLSLDCRSLLRLFQLPLKEKVFRGLYLVS